jgi:hypothetical protein
MELSMVSRSRERMDVLRFDGWQCKIRRQVRAGGERERERDGKGEQGDVVDLGLLMEGNRSYKSIRLLNIRHLNPVGLNRP